MLTVDLLHEYELGLWRDVSAHIVRILEFLGADKVQIFDERYVMQTRRRPMCSPNSNSYQFSASSCVWRDNNTPVR